MNTIEIEDELGITFCNRQSIAIERGEGVSVWDEEGRHYLDFTSGWGVTCLGHSHPVITKAIYNQARKIIQNPNSGFTYSPSRASLLSALKKVLPGNLGKVYFANSGAEANDAAIKLARKVTGRSNIVSTLGSFHGRTFNTLTVSGDRDSVNRYLPQHTSGQFVPFGDISALHDAVGPSTAAVIVEPIQGEGGIRIPDENYLLLAAKICRDAGALLIVDEIQTGFCRTGRFFALQYSKEPLAPDILTMGKGIAGGFPFAAFAVSDQVNRKIQKGDHGGTYCGNPLGCAVATAVVNYLLEQRVDERVAALGIVLRQRLLSLQGKYPAQILSVRGRGLLYAIELEDDAAVSRLTQTCLEYGLLLTPTRGAVIRLIPSLLVTQEELNKGLQLLDQGLAAVVATE